MIKFLKDEWNRLINSPLRQLIYLIVIAVVLGRLAMYYDTTFLRTLALLPFVYLAYMVLKFMIYAWIINPYNAWKERRNK